MKALSTRVLEWSTLPTASLHGKILEMQKSGEDIIDLTIGISNLPIPKEGEQAAIETISKNDVPYTAIGGSLELKEALRKKLKKENNIICDNSNIIVSTGAKQAIFQALYCITDPGDEIMIFQPNWPAYTQIASMLNLKPVFLSFDEISSLPNKKIGPNLKVLILNNPHNPTGRVFSKDDLTAIAAFAKQKGLYILSDESYEKLDYEGEYISFQTVDPGLKDRIITVFSVSQSFSMMGWRLGYAVGNPQVIEAMGSLQSSITAGASAVTQTAVTHILNSEEEYVRKLTAEFKDRRDVVFPKLSGIGWLSCQLPNSGPYFWCDISQVTTDSIKFCEELLKNKKVALMPGEAFGSPGWIRIAFNVASVPTLIDAIERISEFGKSYDQ